MTKHVTIEAVKIKETEPMRHNTYMVKLNGNPYKSFNELSDDYAYTNAIECVNKLLKKYERNHIIEVTMGL